MNPKTIQIFLPDGSPSSIRIAEITSSIVKLVSVPRNKLDAADKRDELKNVGVYFLIGDDEEKAKPIVYIGEAEDCYKRLKQHNKNKDNWNNAVVAISKTNNFTKAHVKYLEYYCYVKAHEIGRWEIDNSNIPTKPFVPEPMEADLFDVYNTIKILLSTLGFPIFEEIPKSKRKSVFVCKGKEAYAEGDYIDEGFVVYKGSKANLTETQSAGEWLINLRKQLIESGVLVKRDEIYEFSSNYIFSSPSAAAATVLARRANGWTEWKNKDGKTLDDVKRKSD
ncbi:GIY-YIG nuclease family protein [Natranaerobius thermophilus]|uniref:DUF4357 domain-containing protein n=1 Tax=Natranaerobius thermophilus (strain ATCC BAA-1301 / DSM 18059 / JW/NM-WN-LF) TaxID=457570 RepID=B2A7T6_NATTJ|nr:GIY-YIG nuclease family protein [Natranaerobius thermophilus]ACB84388.1 conserved hypothetical protein [Natranaerobius thermophilus JW/NM-WN-LF]